MEKTNKFLDVNSQVSKSITELQQKGSCNNVFFSNSGHENKKGIGVITFLYCGDKLYELKDGEISKLSYPNEQGRTFYKVGDIIQISRMDKNYLFILYPELKKSLDNGMSDLLLLVLGVIKLSDLYYTTGIRILNINPAGVELRGVLFLSDGTIIDLKTSFYKTFTSLGMDFNYVHPSMKLLTNILISFTDISYNTLLLIGEYSIAPYSGILKRVGAKLTQRITLKMLKKIIKNRLLEVFTKSLQQALNEGLKIIRLELIKLSIEQKTDILDHQKHNNAVKKIIVHSMKAALSKAFDQVVLYLLLKLKYPKGGEFIRRIENIRKEFIETTLPFILIKSIMHSVWEAYAAGLLKDERLDEKVLKTTVDSAKNELEKMLKWLTIGK